MNRLGPLPRLAYALVLAGAVAGCPKPPAPEGPSVRDQLTLLCPESGEGAPGVIVSMPHPARGKVVIVTDCGSVRQVLAATEPAPQPSGSGREVNVSARSRRGVATAPGSRVFLAAGNLSHEPISTSAEVARESLGVLVESVEGGTSPQLTARRVEGAARELMRGPAGF